MKRIFLVCIAALMLLVNGCYKDDINDLQDQIDKLNKEQQAQSEKMKEYQTLLNALNSKLTVTALTETAEGYKVTFSDGSIMTVKHGTNGQNGTDGTNGVDGQNGADGKNAPAIVSVEEIDGYVLFGMDDGTVIKIRRKSLVGLYILSEGSAGRNQAELAYYDVKTATISKKYFKAKNNTDLGDTGNDLVLYGNKLYCTVSGSDLATDIRIGGYIEVIHPKTGISIKRIPAKDAAGNPDMPRFMAMSGGKVYVTMYSGSVARIDTATLEIDGRAALGGKLPEGICLYGGNLYVCNSGQGPGNTISVVDIATFKETKTITTENNPTSIGVTSTGDIYFTTADYTWGGGNRSNLYKFNVANTSAITAFNCRASSLAVGDNYVYATDFTWNDYSDHAIKVNLKTGAVSDFSDELELYMVYAVQVNPINGDVYITGQGQDVDIFDATGKWKSSLQTGTGYTKKVVPIFD